MPEILFSTSKSIIPETYSNKDFYDKVELFLNNENILQKVHVSDLLLIFDKLSQQWQKKDACLFQLFKELNLGFLIGWLKRNNLEHTLNFSLGDYNVLDKPVLLNKRNIIAAPKGLLVHWISGNVPLLGIISLFQAILTKNKNIIKVPSSFKSVIPSILEDIRKKKFKIKNSIITGEQILKSVLIVHVEKNDFETQTFLSKKADLRIAWGGREAIENITNLNKKIDSEDLIMGPKTSLGVISKEFLRDIETIIDLSRKITRDVFTFDQMGCNSPHNLYLETKSKSTINKFADELYKSFCSESKRLELNNREPIDTYNILCERVFYTVQEDKNLKCEKGYDHNIFIDYKNKKPSAPLYNRSIYLKMVNNINDAPLYFPYGVQTIGIAIPKKRAISFIKLGINYGALRFTEIGKMGIYDAPWDGVMPINRMVKWISIPQQ